MTVITIVVSGKIIKYRGLHCNLTNQTSSVFSVCIESNLPGVQYLEESTVVLKRLGSVRFSFFERNTFFWVKLKYIQIEYFLKIILYNITVLMFVCFFNQINSACE